MTSLEQQTANQIANLERNTGKSMGEWIEIVRASGIEKHAAAVAMLKADHGLGHGYANLVVLRARETAKGGPPAADDLVAQQYGGRHAALRSLYDTLVEAVRRFGADVELSPKKAYVSLRRRKQFAQVGPAAGTLEVGINLPGHAGSERLQAMSGMASHRVRITQASEIDGELLGWLREAYERA